MTEMPNKNKYNLEERTAKFGEDVVRFCNNMPKNEVTRPIEINSLSSKVESKKIKSYAILSKK